MDGLLVVLAVNRHCDNRGSFRGNEQKGATTHCTGFFDPTSNHFQSARVLTELASEVNLTQL